MKDKIITTALIALLMAAAGSAQQTIGPTRYEDDFSALKGDTLKKGLAQLKYLELGKGLYLSFGGEIREQFQHYRNVNFGDVPPAYQDADASQLWHRVMVHTDLAWGANFRFFLQLSNTARFFNDNPLVPEIDENQLSLHQAFVQAKWAEWNFRLGFQEMYFGNHRVITFREGPNTRQSFDGLTIRRAFPNGRIDFFAVSKVVSKRHIFDDESMHDGLFGIYGTKQSGTRKIGLDYYLIHFQSRDRKYNHQSGFENRSTCGFRLFTKLETVNFELEGAYQTGKFNDLDIAAYSVLADVNVLAIPSRKGVLGFSGHIASGDKDPGDGKLNTYNLLYAKPAFGLVAPIGATNMMSLSGYLKMSPVPKLNVLAQAFFLSRNSNRDGVYSPGMVQNRPAPAATADSDRKTLGQLYLLETAYQLTPGFSLAFDGSYLQAGRYPKATGNGEDTLYLSFKSTFKW